MGRNTILIAGAVLFAIVAAVVTFVVGPSNVVAALGFGPSERDLLSQMQVNSSMSGIAITFSDTDTKSWRIAPGHKLERFTAGDGTTAIVRLTSTSPVDFESFDWPTQGLSTQLPLEFATRSNGRQIEVGFIARQAQANPNETLSIIYATQEAGNSTWRQFKLGGHFEMQKFTFVVPNFEQGYTKPPIVVIRSDESGNGKSVEILGLYVKLL